MLEAPKKIKKNSLPKKSPNLRKKKYTQLKEFWNKKKRKKKNLWSHLLQFSSWLASFFHFFLSPQLLTATLAVILQFFFFFFSLSFSFLIFLFFFGAYMSFYWPNLTLVRYCQFSPTMLPTWPITILMFFSFLFFLFFNDIGFFPLTLWLLLD